MQLEQKYELLEAINDLSGDRDQAIPAWERSTGKQVFVHLLAGGYSSENNAVLTAVGRLSPEHRQHVLGAGDHLGNAYVITDALPWGISLRKWIETIQGKPETPGAAISVPPASAPASSKPDASEPSPLARAGTWRIPVFNPGGQSAASAPPKPAPPPVPAVPPPPVAASPAPVATRPAAPPPQKEPGEFTRVMMGISPDSVATDEMPAPTASAPVTKDSQPGEFTQLMRAASKPEGLPVPPAPAAPQAIPEMPPPAPPARHSADTNPGEFTKLLRSYNPGGSKPAFSPAPPTPPATAPPPIPVQRVAPPSPEAPPMNLPRRAPPPPPAPATEMPWQFDKPSPPPPVPSAAPAEPGGFTEILQGKQPLAAPPPAMSAPPQPSPIVSPKPEGEFTRMMRTPGSTGDSFAPPVPSGPADADLFKAPAPAAPAAKGGPSFTQVMAASAVSAPSAAQPAAAAPAPAAAKSKTPYLVLGIVLGLLIVLTVVLVLLLRH